LKEYIEAGFSEIKEQIIKNNELILNQMKDASMDSVDDNFIKVRIF
jgi:hypothetical protein